MSLSYSAGGVMPLPLLAWDFNGTTTDYVSGLAPTTRTGTITYGSGKYLQSVVFTNTAGSTASNALTYTLSSITSLTNGFTVSCWFKINSVPPSGQRSGIWRVPATGTGNGGAYMLYYASGQTNFGYTQTDQVITYVEFNANFGTLTVGTWYHAVYTISGTSQTAYLNGVLKATDSRLTATYTLTNPTMSLGFHGSFGDAFNGEADDLRIYNTALTAAQVQAVYRAQGMPSRGIQVNTRVPIASMIGQTFTPANTSATPPDTSVAGQISLTVAANNSTNQGQVYLTPALTGVSFSIVYKLNSDTTNFGGPVCLLSSAGDCFQLSMAFGSTSLVARKFLATVAYAFASTTVTSSGVTIYATCVLAPNGYVYLYVNGALVSSGTTDSLPLPNKLYSVFLGRNRFSNLVDTTIWDFFVVNATLSASQVSTLYQSQLANINYNPGNTMNWIPTRYFKK